MPNPDPRVEALFDKIAKEQIQVDPVLWTVIYQHIGDSVIVINLLVRYYVDDNQTIPKDEAKRILDHAKRIEETIRKLAHWRAIPENEADPLFREIKEKSLKLDPLTYELIVDRVLNDIHIIDLTISRYMYPPDKTGPISTEDAQKVLCCTRSSISFLDRLRQATAKKEAY